MEINNDIYENNIELIKLRIEEKKINLISSLTKNCKIWDSNP